ncbi:hypothetical protein BKN14_02100 [Candidatus Gracilibacteria bacterium HOT-871]|nr:hypothetical protein BKN14_02100 [Candidatus Gracilibacteria bacterium HOT-871]MBB1565121.1 patatin-like phospholipase family protein [Candidatus Gracilibacteria bacterium]MBF0913460.1 patatin-like phospholipase family protein [Candidatus Gracilibacteria bacterium]RKW22764.1 MAG: hypothetical protein D8B46_04745 [Candidatus Gracilibacteria bacterium]
MKKKYGLALGGGSARGFVHIGVLKYLEEKNIEIGEITGTSMGALIGALCAMGKNSKEIKKIAKEINYMKLFDFDFIYGSVKGDKVKKKIKYYFGDLKIEELKIKLKIIATNLETGEKKVFESGSIVDALRASISIPGVFKPYKIGKDVYVDGLVVDNLPIDELSLENKIGVSAIKLPSGPLSTKRKVLGIQLPKFFLNLNYQILYRTIVNLMYQNEAKSIEIASGNKQVLHFDFGKLEFFNFSKVDKFVEIGYETAKKNLKF